MFFCERIRSIGSTDNVLEIGPGGHPHPRSNVLLEKVFDDPAEAERQRGAEPPLRDTSNVVRYDGGRFPFKDKEFDYVICSHVLEHVEDVDSFVAEVARVGSKGYVEYPLVYYEYLFDFSAHVTILFESKGTVYWMPKSELGLDKYKRVTGFFLKSLAGGYSDIVDDLKPHFFQGFEWFGSLKTCRVRDLDLLTFEPEGLALPPKKRPWLHGQTPLRVLRTLRQRLRRQVDR